MKRPRHASLGSQPRRAFPPEVTIKALEAEVAANPKAAEPAYRLARVLMRQKKTDEALPFAQRALDRAPQEADFALFLGELKLQLGNLEGAHDALTSAYQLAPDRAETSERLGQVERLRGEAARAAALFKKSLAINPASGTARLGLALSLSDQGNHAQAAEVLGALLASQASHPLAHAMLAQELMHLGRWKEALVHYERRPMQRLMARTLAPLPPWDGTLQKGLRLLLCKEQGYGDQIHMIRFVPQLAAAGLEVTLLCDAALASLFSRVAGVKTILTSDPDVRRFDAWLSLVSLPHRLKIDQPPPFSPYLTAEPARVEVWRKRLNPSNKAKTLKVGLAWSGNAAHPRDKMRSLALQDLAPLLGQAGVTFYALQLGAAHQQIEQLDPTLRPSDLSGEIKDFEDNAAILSQLDLLICVDTAMAHLAGALGRPCWVLSARPGDPRWSLSEDETPWYPSLRLFKQDTPGAWAPVLARVSAELKVLAHG